jgi:hypothetical protein
MFTDIKGNMERSGTVALEVISTENSTEVKCDV